MAKCTLMVILVSFINIQQFSSLQFDLRFHYIPKINTSKPDHLSTYRELFEKDLKQIYIHLITVNLCIGIPEQCFDLAYDIAVHQTWITDKELNQYVNHSYDIDKSSTVQKQKEKTRVEGNLAYEIKEKIINWPSKGDTEELFSILVAITFKTKETLPYDGALGLNRNYRNKIILIEKGNVSDLDIKFSIIEFLYLNKHISRRVFAHKRIDNNRGILFIGETGSEQTNYPTCRSKSNQKFEDSYYSTYWHCYATAIYNHNTGKEIVDLSIEAVFDSNVDYIAFPESIGHALFSYLTKEGNMSNCKLDVGQEMSVSLFCDDIDKTKVPSLSFYISGFNITVSPDDFIEEETIQNDKGVFKQYRLRMIYNHLLTMSFVVGTYALMKQHMIFDYDNNSVGFITLKDTDKLITPLQQINLKDSMSFTIIIIYISFGVVSLIILSLILFYVRRKQLKYKNRQMLT